MPYTLPKLLLARHGDTDWNDSRRWMGRTDLLLNGQGEQRARQFGDHWHRCSFAQVFTSPLHRASGTCALAGFGNLAEEKSDLVERDYGRFEEKNTADIQQDRPDWELFRYGCSGGETLADVARRADRIISQVFAADGDVLAFSSSHIIRMIAARWLDCRPTLDDSSIVGQQASACFTSNTKTRTNPSSTCGTSYAN